MFMWGTREIVLEFELRIADNPSVGNDRQNRRLDMGTYDAWLKKNERTKHLWSYRTRPEAFIDLVTVYGITKFADGKEMLAVRAHTGELEDSEPKLRDEDIIWGNIEGIVLEIAPRLGIKTKFKDEDPNDPNLDFDELIKEFDRIKSEVREKIAEATTPDELPEEAL